MEEKSNAIQIHKILAYAPQYISALMRLLTIPSKFFSDELLKEKPSKEAMKFLVASFLVATARILYGRFESISAVESSIRWDSVISCLFIVGGLALLIYMLLHVFRSALDHDQCLICAIYFMGAVFIFMALPYSICMPLLAEVTQSVSQISDPSQLTNGKFYFFEGQLLFMLAVIVGSFVIWPTYIFWGIGRAGGLGVIRNSGFSLVMLVASMSILIIVALGPNFAGNKSVQNTAPTPNAITKAN